MNEIRIIINIFLDTTMIRQYICFTNANSDSMFKMSRNTSITSTDSPAIISLIYVPFSQVDHRFDGDHPSGLEFFPFSSSPVIRYLWLFMKFATYPMSHQLPYHTIIIFSFSMSLHSTSAITYSVYDNTFS